jgi:hypothetical protein
MRVILEDRRGIPCIDYAGGLRFQTKMIHDQDNIPWHRAWSVLVLAHSGIPGAVVSHLDSSFNDGLDNGLTKVCRYPQSFPTLRKHSQGKYRPNGVAAGPEGEGNRSTWSETLIKWNSDPCSHGVTMAPACGFITDSLAGKIKQNGLVTLRCWA